MTDTEEVLKLLKEAKECIDDGFPELSRNLIDEAIQKLQESSSCEGCSRASEDLFRVKDVK
jgi:hypothetical protein